LKGINLDIRPSEKIAVIGPSGSGKTTIIRLLMTLEEPTKGDIYVAGKNLWKMEKSGKSVPAKEKHLTEVRKDIGIGIQHFNLVRHKTILDNCATTLIKVKNKKKEEAREEAKQMLDRVGLGDKYDAYPSNLSGGQKQRVAMARALVMKP